MLEMKMVLHDPEELRFAAEFCQKLADRREGLFGQIEPASVRESISSAPSAPEAEPEAEETTRAYGEPSGGRKRRTKEEMAEDQEIEELAAKLGVQNIPTDAPASLVLQDFNRALKDKAGKPATEPAKEVTGEIVEDEPAAPQATRDDLKAAMQKLVEAKGMQDGMEAISDVFGEYGKKKQSEFDDDPALFAEVIGKLEARLS